MITTSFNVLVLIMLDRNSRVIFCKLNINIIIDNDIVHFGEFNDFSPSYIT